jgi:hypothetical protein
VDNRHEKNIPIILYTLLLISLTSQAHAYLDPGTGSMMLQIVIASVVGALFSLKIFWSRIKNFFSTVFFKNKK